MDFFGVTEGLYILRFRQVILSLQEAMGNCFASLYGSCKVFDSSNCSIDINLF